MKIYERVAFALSIILLALIVARMIDLWYIASSFLILMLITLLYKLYFEKRIEELEKGGKRKEALLNKIIETVERISGVVINIRNEFREATFSLEQRILSQREEIEKKMRKDYYDLADKIIDLENRINKIKKILGTCISYLEEKIRKEEERYE